MVLKPCESLSHEPRGKGRDCWVYLTHAAPRHEVGLVQVADYGDCGELGAVNRLVELPCIQADMNGKQSAHRESCRATEDDTIEEIVPDLRVI